MPRSSVHGEMEKLFTDTILFLDRKDYSGTKRESRPSAQERPKRHMDSILQSPRSPFGPPQSGGFMSGGTLHTLHTDRSMHSPTLETIRSGGRMQTMPSWKSIYEGKSHYDLDVDRDKPT